MKRCFLAAFLFGFMSMVAQAVPTQDYFPKDTEFSSEIPLPENYLGYEIGDWHISPDALTGYMRTLAEQSSRVSIETIGYSYERKALSHVYISSPENIANLDAVLEKHKTAKSAKDDILILNLAYTVHGNEASGANAAPLVAYYLAASQEDWVREFLTKTVVIIEPVQNPDGLARFTVWVNEHKGSTENFDNANRDHNGGWPSGRTNHYWFDLNRDWIFTVHPESKARIKAYQKWRPHVLGDYHEMGGNIPSYFFQPGHAKRTHPLTLKENQRITFGLAEFHAKALDARAQPYYTQERFDDFYYGKGSAYPDAAGAIGLLFEQSAVRGHARELGGEKVRFADGIANHLATSLSLIKGADAYREDILKYRFKFLDQQELNALRNPVKAYVFSDDGDPERARKLLEILKIHNIPVYNVLTQINVNGQKYKPGHAWAVKLTGAQYGLVLSLFETRTTFEDTVFYDISTWNLPLALGLPYAPLNNINSISRKPFDMTKLPKIADWQGGTPVAYAFEWNQYRAPHLLQAMMAEGLHPRLTILAFSSDTTGGERHEFKSGTIVVQPITNKEHIKVRKAMAVHENVKVYGLTSGLTPTGPDLGSRGMKVLKAVKPALLVGDGVRTVEAGEIRYTVDKTFGVPLTILDIDRLGKTDLTKYTHFLLADGTYSAYNDAPKILTDWVKAGGIIIAQKDAAKWLEKQVIWPPEKASKKDKQRPSLTDFVRKAYQDYEQEQGRQRIAGAVLNTDADLTHPLMFGYRREQNPVLFNAKTALEFPPNSYDVPLIYPKDNILITGYGDDAKLATIAGTPAITLHRMGKGKIVLFSHDSLFRAIWRGSERQYANALFFTQAIDERKDTKAESADRRNED